VRVKLIQTRKDAGLTVADMATKFGISKSFYYKIEAGVRNPTITLANEIALLFGKTVDDLFFNNQLDESSNDNNETSATCESA